MAKGATEGQAFLAKNQPYSPRFNIPQTVAGLAEFETRIQQLAAYADCLPVMILESTGPYHALVARFLEDHGKLSQDKLTRIFLGEESPPRAHQSAAR